MHHFTIHPVTPQKHLIERAARILISQEGICIYPTDTVYGMGASVRTQKAMHKIARILEKDKKRLFSFICRDFSQASQYAHINNDHFKMMKRLVPGPYTFILHATTIVPRKITKTRKYVGIRIPDCPVCYELVSCLGQPLANTSVPVEGARRGDPGAIVPAVKNNVDVILDAGELDEPVGSTIVDLTGTEPGIIRQGKGKL
jgi:tRNA threonylcarbamoyl adenosine modification protein (Sua5/YciO/YrdC/YwlC family)